MFSLQMRDMLINAGFLIKRLQYSEEMTKLLRSALSLWISRSLAKDTNETISILQKGKSVSKGHTSSKWQSGRSTQVFRLTFQQYKATWPSEISFNPFSYNRGTSAVMQNYAASASTTQE